MFNFSFEEISDPDADEDYGDEDEFYVPSLWEMSISVSFWKLILLCLMPFSTIFNMYRGGQYTYP